MPDWISHEPVAWVAFVDAVIMASIMFGAPITNDQKAAIIGVVVGVSTLFVRSKVTPTAKIAAVPLAARALKDAGQG